MGFYDKPVRAGAFTPRKYQLEADAGIDHCLDGGPHFHDTPDGPQPCDQPHRSTLVVQATGCGKTVLFCMQAKKRGNGLILVHRDSLGRQAAKKLTLATGEHVAVEKAERHAFGSSYIVGSVQTLKGERLARFAERFRDTINFIVTDEAHRSTAAGYRKIYEAFPYAKLLGVTATPDRSDGIAMGSVYDSVAHRYDIIQATRDAWLTPVDYVPVSSDVNLDSIGVRGKDLDADQLDDAIGKEAGRIARAVVDQARDLRLIVFTPGVKTAHAVAGAINALVPGAAAAVDGTMDDDAKERAEEAHRAGELRYLVNCNIYTEGYDDPNLDGVFDASPSMSRIRVMQRVGRPTRLYETGVEGANEIGAVEDLAERHAAIAASPKPKAYWFDLVCNGEAHSIVGPLDVLAGTLPDDVRKEAKKLLKEKGGNVDAAISEARERLDARATAMRAGILAARAKSKRGRVRSIFELAGVAHLQRGNVPVRPEDMATPKQVGALKSRGIPVPQECSKQMFKRLIGKDEKQRKSGFCRLGGMHWLSLFGIDAHRMPSATAKRLQVAIIDNGRRPLAPERLRELTTRQPGGDV